MLKVWCKIYYGIHFTGYVKKLVIYILWRKKS